LSKPPQKNGGGFLNVNENLLRFTKSLAVVFVLCVLLPLPFSIYGYDSVLVALFAISNLLIWADGFLTYFALKVGATEINPIIAISNKLVGKKRGLFLSRLVGSIFCFYGLIEKKQPALLAITWIMSIVICMNSIVLSSNVKLVKILNVNNSKINSRANDADNSDNQRPLTKIKRSNVRKNYPKYPDKKNRDKDKKNKLTELAFGITSHLCHLQCDSTNFGLNTYCEGGELRW
jgi:preprotein translocase subunit SecG